MSDPPVRTAIRLDSKHLWLTNDTNRIHYKQYGGHTGSFCTCQGWYWLRSKVSTEIVTWYTFAWDSKHKADNDFLLS